MILILGRKPKSSEDMYQDQRRLPATRYASNRRDTHNIWGKIMPNARSGERHHRGLPVARPVSLLRGTSPAVAIDLIGISIDGPAKSHRPDRCLSITRRTHEQAQKSEQSISMPTISRSHLPQPKDWDEFEEMCADVFGAEWSDRNATRYGRQGQRQHGVDIYGKPSGGYAGVQCKGRRRWPPPSLTTREIDEEVAKALKFCLLYTSDAADDLLCV